MCTIDTRDRVSIDTGSTLDRDLGQPSVDPRFAHGQRLRRQTFNFR